MYLDRFWNTSRFQILWHETYYLLLCSCPRHWRLVGLSFYSSAHSQPRCKMGMNSEYHTPSVLREGEKPLHIVYETVWAPEPVSRFWRREKSLPLLLFELRLAQRKTRPAFTRIFWSQNTFYLSKYLHKTCALWSLIFSSQVCTSVSDQMKDSCNLFTWTVS